MVFRKGVMPKSFEEILQETHSFIQAELKKLRDKKRDIDNLKKEQSRRLKK